MNNASILFQRWLIYTTNTIERYHRQLRKVMKNKAAFPRPEAAPDGHPKLLYLATQDITKKWTMPIQNWANIRINLREPAGRALPHVCQFDGLKPPTMVAVHDSIGIACSREGRKVVG